MRSRLAAGMFTFVLALTATKVFAADETTYTTIDFPGAAATYAFGISPNDDIVGSYVDSARTRLRQMFRHRRPSR